MAAVQSKTIVGGSEQVEETKVRKEGRFLFFKTIWWEVVSSKHIGNDIHIESDREIRQVYLNGKPLIDL